MNTDSVPSQLSNALSANHVRCFQKSDIYANNILSSLLDKKLSVTEDFMLFIELFNNGIEESIESSCSRIFFKSNKATLRTVPEHLTDRHHHHHNAELCSFSEVPFQFSATRTYK